MNVHEAKTNFSALLAKLEEDGQPIVICRNGHPVANLVALPKRSRVKPHPALKKIQINYDPTEPLSDQEWPGGSR